LDVFFDISIGDMLLLDTWQSTKIGDTLSKDNFIPMRGKAYLVRLSTSIIMAGLAIRQTRQNA